MTSPELSLVSLEALADGCPMALIVVRLEAPGDSRSLRIIHVNRALDVHSDKRAPQVLGRLLHEGFPGVSEEGFVARIMRVLRSGEIESYDDLYYQSDQIVAAFSGHMARVGPDIAAVWFENSTRRKQLEAEAARAAALDAETRRQAAFVAELEAANQRAQDALETYELVARAAEEVLWEVRLDPPGALPTPETPCRFSDRLAEMIGCAPAELRHTLGAYGQIVHPEDVERVGESFRMLYEDPTRRREDEYRILTRTGEILHVHASGQGSVDAEGRPRKLAGTIRDVTPQKLAEAELRQRLALIEEQRSLIQRLSAPILEVWEDVIALPIVGGLDGDRASATMDALLDEIARKGVRFALLDLTGVETLDTNTAEHLVRIAQAVSLLGARAIITGVRPAVAQTIVALGIDLSVVETRRNLRDGLRECLQRVTRERPLARRGTGPG